MRELIDENHLHGGSQKVYKFDNGYGASVVSHQYSYGGSEGLFEVAVINFDINPDGFVLVYDTPITSDVLGWQDDIDVEEVLDAIEKLPKRVVE